MKQRYYAEMWGVENSSAGSVPAAAAWATTAAAAPAAVAPAAIAAALSAEGGHSESYAQQYLPSIHSADNVAASSRHSSKSASSTLRPDAVPNPSIVSVVEDSHLRIGFLTDVEGRWSTFCQYMRVSKCLSFATHGIHLEDHALESSRVEIAGGWHFVYGGDCSGKGSRSLLFIQTLVDLKKRHPDRVHLLLGGRDIGQIRMTSELAETEIKRLWSVPGPFWSVNKQSARRPLDYVREVASKEEGVPLEAVTEEMVGKHNTKATRLRYLLEWTMDAAEDFEFRRDEVASAKGLLPEQLADAEVVASFEKELAEGGHVREYLKLAQLVVVLGETIFVHGQLIGNKFDSGPAQTLGILPGAGASQQQTSETDIRRWAEQLNTWCTQQVEDWEQKPQWSNAPFDNTVRDWAGRGAAGLIAYGTSACLVPSVVSARWLDHDGMPQQYPLDFVSRLREQRVRRVIAGHLGFCGLPMVVPHDGLSVILAGTGKSAATLGDDRGLATSHIAIDGDACRVIGRTQGHEAINYYADGPNADGFIGKLVALPGQPRRPYAIMAKLQDESGAHGSYLLCRAEGAGSEQKVVSMEELADLLAQGRAGSVVLR